MLYAPGPSVVALVQYRQYSGIVLVFCGNKSCVVIGEMWQHVLVAQIGLLTNQGETRLIAQWPRMNHWSGDKTVCWEPESAVEIRESVRRNGSEYSSDRKQHSRPTPNEAGKVRRVVFTIVIQLPSERVYKFPR